MRDKGNIPSILKSRVVGKIYTAGGDVCGSDPIAGHVVGQAGIAETRVSFAWKDLGYILRVGIALARRRR